MGGKERLINARKMIQCQDMVGNGEDGYKVVSYGLVKIRLSYGRIIIRGREGKERKGKNFPPLGQVDCQRAGTVWIRIDEDNGI